MGDLGTSSNVGCRLFKSDEFVLRLSWLGLRFMAGILGLIKDGEEGSDTSVLLNDTGWIDRPFMFRGFRGEGEVIGRTCEVV